MLNEKRTYTARQSHFLAGLTLLILQCCITSLYASSEIGVHGNWSKNYLGLETHTSQSYRGTISTDLISIFRIGYSYRHGYQHREGYQDVSADPENPSYRYFEQDVLQKTHSVDLFIILYAGEMLTPYIFVGMARKDYEITIREEGGEPTHAKATVPGPTWGAGLAIALSSNFVLKASNTWSIGQTTNIQGETKMMQDSQMDVGISYRL
jgi:opacity protein-like surface antigen